MICSKQVCKELKAVAPGQLKVLGAMCKPSAHLLHYAVATLSPTLAASFLSGLSTRQILTLSCAAFAGALSIALPEIVDLWQEKRKTYRNGISYLLALQKSYNIKISSSR